MLAIEYANEILDLSNWIYKSSWLEHFICIIIINMPMAGKGIGCVAMPMLAAFNTSKVIIFCDCTYLHPSHLFPYSCITCKVNTQSTYSLGHKSLQ